MLSLAENKAIEAYDGARLYQNYKYIDRDLVYLDSFIINPTYNTDGIGNCLQQPGQLSNQLHKSMRSKSFPLIKISVL